MAVKTVLFEYKIDHDHGSQFTEEVIRSLNNRGFSFDDKLAPLPSMDEKIKRSIYTDPKAVLSVCLIKEKAVIVFTINLEIVRYEY